MRHINVFIVVFVLLIVGAVQAQESSYNEAPALAEQVAAGTLPPVAERLPEEPLVHDKGEVGVYGGEWVMGIEGDDNVIIMKTMLYDGLVRWNASWTDVVPNLATSWEVQDEGQRYVFNLRRGVKWSDGTPFTSADIMFWAEHVLDHEEIDRSVPRWMRTGGEKPTISAPDEYTIVFEWPVPHGTFLYEMANPQGLELTHYQAAYSKRFHADFTPEVVQQAAEAGLDNWVELWEQKVDYSLSGINARNQNPELPTLTAWVFTGVLGEGEQLVAVRNPYYWKVDAAGNQLPYIDRIVYRNFSDREVMRLQAAAGAFNFQDRRLGGASYAEIYAQNAEANNFRLFSTIVGNATESVIAFNLTHKDPVKNAIYNDKNFRIALSHAINREEINQIVAFGLSQPQQPAPRPESEFYDAEFATQYTEYNVELANQLLDEAGYPRGADGFRVGPDGNPLILNVTSDSESDSYQLIIGYWEAVGIQATFTQQDRSLFRETTDNNDHDVIFRSAGEGGLGIDVLIAPRWYMPISNESMFGVGWWTWQFELEDNPGAAVEPPDVVKQQYALFDEMRATADPDRQRELMREILAIAKDQFYVIGTILPLDEIGIISNDFYNVFPPGGPETMFNTYNWPQPGPLAPEQFFIRSS